MLYQLSYSRPWRCAGRDGRIRTADPLLPKQVRYQAAPRPGAGQYTAPAGHSLSDTPWEEGPCSSGRALRSRQDDAPNGQGYSPW